jgi:hypothetical protein
MFGKVTPGQPGPRGNLWVRLNWKWGRQSKANDICRESKDSENLVRAHVQKYLYNEKDAMSMQRLQGGFKNQCHGHAVQRPVLTNQCLAREKKRVLSRLQVGEELRSESEDSSC